MRKLKISDDLSLPLDAVTQKFAFLGRTGSGKTFAAKKLAELMLAAGAQVIVLDPVGVWFGLRLGSQAFAVPVLGGLHGDIPLEPTGGAVIADLVFDRSLSVVLDVSQMTDADATRFATGFAARFFQRQKAAPTAVHVFLEECQHFAPQEPQRNETVMLHEFQKLSKLGRNFGIGVSLISQRPQEVNKKVLNQSECLFAFQMTGPQERKAMEAWVSEKGIDADIKAILPKLAVGEPHVWSPQWLKVSEVVRILPIRSLDTSSTPKVGAKQRAAQALTPIDLKQLQTAMAATIERAKADDPRALKARIAELEKAAKVRVKPMAAPAPVVERVEVPVFDSQRFESLVGFVTERLAGTQESLDALSKVVSQGRGDIGRSLASYRSGCVAAAKAAPRGRPVALPEAIQPRPAETLGQKAERAGNGEGDPSIGNSGLRRMMVALAQRPAGLTQRQLGVRAGVSSKGGSFATYLSRGRTAGWIEGRGHLKITPAGIEALGEYEPLPHGRELLQYWLNELGQSGAARILRVVADAFPAALTQAEIGERAEISPKGGSFATYLSRLRTLDLISGRGELIASEELFD